MISMTVNGMTTNVLEDKDFHWELDVYLNNAQNFKKYFDTYLLNEFGCDSDQLKEIIHDIAPEKFI